MDNKLKLTPSLEDYLETILQLETKNRVARVKDIAKELGVQMPSVTGALKNLKSKGMIEYEKNSFINLTEEGLKLATGVFEKHKLLVSFLINVLQMDEDKARDFGCKIEHIIDIDTAKKFGNLEEYLGSLEDNWKDKISK